MASQASTPQDPSRPPHRPHRPSFQLTEEEKAVLLECRRNSMFRGFALGTPSILVLRWFINQGRVPVHMQRRSWLYYAGLFTGSFFVGVSSYKQRCFDKIMALDNSQLADQLREHLSKDWSECVKSDSDGTVQGHHEKHHQGHRKHHHPPPLSTPAPSPPSPSSHMGYKEGSGSYRGDKTTTSGRPYDHRQLDSRPSELQQEAPSDQPDAFGGSSGGVTGTEFQASSPEQGGQGQWATPTGTRGRTFDEIREDSRRQQLQKNFPRVGRGEEGRNEEAYVEKGDWRQRQETRGSGRPVRRNKYGDIIED